MLSPSYNGPVDEIGSSPCQSSGLAPGSPSRASSASEEAAAAASARFDRGSARVRRSRPVKPRSDRGGFVAESSSDVSAGSSEKNMLRCSSSLATAASTTRSVARETASANMRSSSSSTSLRSSMARSAASPADPSPDERRARSRFCGCSSEPRARRLGHTPSCRAATTTVRNSRPTAPDGVVTSTASSRPLGASTSSGTSASSTSARNSEAGASGRRSAKRFAAVNRATIASRLRLASAAIGPLPSAWSCQGFASLLRSQASQSRSSMEPSLVRSASSVSARCSACRAGRLSMVTKRPGAASASTSNSSLTR